MQLYFRRKWLLITEISFNSESTEDKRPPNNFSNLTTCSVVITPSVPGVSKPPSPGCKNCSTFTIKPTHRDEAEIQKSTHSLAISLVTVGVIFIIVFVVVTMFLLYKRRRQDGKLTTVDVVEMQPRPETLENVQNLSQAEVETAPDEQDYVIPNNIVTGPYQEVQISHAEIDKNRQETIDDSKCEKLSKDASGYVIPNEGHPKTDEEVAKTNSLPGYTKLDNTKRDNEGNSYQKLIYECNRQTTD
ncbi:uncharacterized protein LOC114533657 [Dendronephthya gigantea]|uniref:uncharacterized protein LOC114533657 n=1 Tax=Dendronephthya gigantea TaxID=151771 RepID=UPI00106ACE7A|nr:uncharacterized protein LOC114533657 [Dendronephthya gigantea]